MTGFITGFPRFLLTFVVNFLGLLVAIVGFVWEFGAGASGQWLYAALGVPVLLLGAWLHFNFGNDT